MEGLTVRLVSNRRRPVVLHFVTCGCAISNLGNNVWHCTAQWRKNVTRMKCLQIQYVDDYEPGQNFTLALALSGMSHESVSIVTGIEYGDTFCPGISSFSVGMLVVITAYPKRYTPATYFAHRGTEI